MVNSSAYMIPGLKNKESVFRDEFEQFWTVINLVSDEMGISSKKMIDKGRKRPYVTARHIAMYLIRQHIPTTSLLKIGKFFGGRDHTTVIHACQSVRDLRKTDEMYRALLIRLEGRVIKAL